MNVASKPSGDDNVDCSTTTHSLEALPRVSFESLAQGRSEVLIEFRGQLYRLRATRNGKLILNK
jgi:hemin uptake protein HemP